MQLVKMTQDHPMMTNFSTINKSISCLTVYVCWSKKHRLFKDFRPHCMTGKMYIRHHFNNRALQEIYFKMSSLWERSLLMAYIIQSFQWFLVSLCLLISSFYEDGLMQVSYGNADFTKTSRLLTLVSTM